MVNVENVRVFVEAGDCTTVEMELLRELGEKISRLFERRAGLVCRGRRRKVQGLFFRRRFEQ